MKLLESTENEITENKDSENLPHLEITEVVLVHCNIVNKYYQQYIQEFRLPLFLINHLVVY